MISGGLMRGRGMTKQQGVIWLLCKPVCTEVNKAMQEFTEEKDKSSHDMNPGRIVT